MGIARYVFFSIQNCDKHPEVPLMLIKSCTEEYLQKSGMDVTIFRLCGFMQVIPWPLIQGSYCFRAAMSISARYAPTSNYKCASAGIAQRGIDHSTNVEDFVARVKPHVVLALCYMFLHLKRHLVHLFVLYALMPNYYDSGVSSSQAVLVCLERLLLVTFG